MIFLLYLSAYVSAPSSEDSLPGATVFRSFRPIQRYFVGTRRSKAASRVSIVAEQSAHLDHRGALVEIDALLCPLLLYEISNCLSRLVLKNKTDAIVAQGKAGIQPRQWAPRQVDRTCQNWQPIGLGYQRCRG